MNSQAKSHDTISPVLGCQHLPLRMRSTVHNPGQTVLRQSSFSESHGANAGRLKGKRVIQSTSTSILLAIMQVKIDNNSIITVIYKFSTGLMLSDCLGIICPFYTG